MEKEDARYQTLERLHERRTQVVRLHKNGIKIMQIFTLTGLSYPTVKHSIELYERGSWVALRPADRGRSKGQGRVLSMEQEDAVRGSIIDQRPEQLKMDFCLWSRRAVSASRPIAIKSARWNWWLPDSRTGRSGCAWASARTRCWTSSSATVQNKQRLQAKVQWIVPPKRICQIPKIQAWQGFAGDLTHLRTNPYAHPIPVGQCLVAQPRIF